MSAPIPAGDASASASASTAAAAAAQRLARPLRLLVSVRNLDEARLAAAAGVDFIDLKEPSAGALGSLPDAVAREIVPWLREHAPKALISATTGDLPSAPLGAVLARVDAVAASGVDYVKVGIDQQPGALALLDALAAHPAAIVPVLLADAGVNRAQVARALALRRFPALMLDTAAKGQGSLLDRVDAAALAQFIAMVQHEGRCLAGLAGALRQDELPALRSLAPDFAGFRSAVCAGDRSGALDPARLHHLCEATRRVCQLG